MKVIYSSALCALALLAGCDQKKSESRPPIAKKIPFEIVSSHGHKRTDPYYWMKNREDSAVVSYLKEENAYAESVLAPLKPLQEELFNEMKSRIQEKDESAPYALDDYFYYTRYEEGFEYPVYCRKKGSLQAQEELILNANDLSKGQSFLDAYAGVSPDHTITNIVYDTVGRRFYTVKFKDIATNAMLPDRIDGTPGEVQWFNDNKTVVYTKRDPITLIANKVYRHVMGTSSAEDVLIYEESDSTLSCSISKTATEKYIIITSSRTDASFQQIIDADDPKSRPLVITPLQDNVKYSADHDGTNLYIHTNLNATNYKIVMTPVSKPGHQNWKDVVPVREDVLIEDWKIFKDYLVLQENKGGVTRLRVIRRADNAESFIAFDEPAYSASIGHNPEFNTAVLRYYYESLSTPPSVYDYNLATGSSTLIKQQNVPGGFDRKNYTTERLLVKATDGKEIPVSLVYHKEKFKKDGSAPCLQYGYGSYGYSSPVVFRSSVVSLLDRGFVFAIAHVRGGQEMGGEWYNDGKMLNKKNTFTDFIACSEHLVKNGYTSQNKLFASGGSAGGLLMGAIANMRPDLYKGIVAHVPFVDVVTTMMDETIPLTTFEWKEWGNPNVREEYEYMLSYSPYDNVEKKEYPHMFVLTGFHDSQVQYWEPAKWVARLREMKTGDNLLLFKTNMNAGHGGSYGRFERMKETSLWYSFIIGLAGDQLP